MRNPKKKFAKIYDKLVDKIYRFVFLKVGSEEVAEDLTAQVFAKGWERFSTGEDIRNPSAYLYQMARAEIANHFRQNSKFKLVSAETNQLADPQPGIEERQQGQSEIEALRTCLAKLNDDYQNVLIWRYLDGYSNKEIARMLEKSEGAVRVMLHRGLKELRQKMENNEENNQNRAIF